MPFLEAEELADLGDLVGSDLIQGDILYTVESAADYQRESSGKANDLAGGPSVVALEDDEDLNDSEEAAEDFKKMPASAAKKRGRPSLARSEIPAKPSAAKTPHSAKAVPIPKSAGRKRKAPKPEVGEEAEDEPEEEDSEPAKKRGRPRRSAAVVTSARLAKKEANKPTRGRPKSTTTATTAAVKPAKGKGGRPRKDTSNGDSTPAGEYEVEEIVDSAVDADTKQHKYQVKWKGYPSSENTWEPKQNLTHALDLVKAFDAKKEAEAEEEKAGAKEARAAAAPAKEKKQPKEKVEKKGKPATKAKEAPRASGRPRREAKA